MRHHQEHEHVALRHLPGHRQRVDADARPDMLFCVATGLKSGLRAGFRAALGAASGEVVHISASAVGLAALFCAAPPLFDAVRILGARGVRKNSVALSDSPDLQAGSSQ
jgi:hypothetical protein